MTMMDCDNHHFYNKNEECSEIHTIQIFREAKDDGDNGAGSVVIFSPSSPAAAASSAKASSSTNSTTFHYNSGTVSIAGGTCEGIADVVAPIGRVEPRTTSTTPTITMDGGIGDDHAVLDMAIDVTATAASHSPFTATATTIDMTAVHNGNKGTNFYSFFFNDDDDDDDDDDTEQTAAQHDDVQQPSPPLVNIVDYEETIKENMDVVAIDGSAATADGSDDFSVTSQDTDSSPEDWMNLDLDENILQDSTPFWEHGLAASCSSWSTSSANPELVAADSHSQPVHEQHQQHVPLRISALDLPLR